MRTEARGIAQFGTDFFPLIVCGPLAKTQPDVLNGRALKEAGLTNQHDAGGLGVHPQFSFGRAEPESSSRTAPSRRPATNPSRRSSASIWRRARTTSATSKGRSGCSAQISMIPVVPHRRASDRGYGERQQGRQLSPPAGRRRGHHEIGVSENLILTAKAAGHQHMADVRSNLDNEQPTLAVALSLQEQVARATPRIPFRALALLTRSKGPSPDQSCDARCRSLAWMAAHRTRPSYDVVARDFRAPTAGELATQVRWCRRRRRFGR
jgi:hypothetical protein